MKPIYLTVISTVLTIAGFAQVKVPAAVQNAFNAKFPAAANVKWGKENAREYEAEFKLNNMDVSANFGIDGSWKETEATIPLIQLPAAVAGAVNSTYPGRPILLTEKIEKSGGQTFYEVTITYKGKSKELELDEKGGFIK